MISKQSGNAFVPFLVGLAVGLVVGWMVITPLVAPPGVELLEEGERAVPKGAVLVDEVDNITKLSDEQIKDLGLVLENECNWPDTCEPRTARDLLEEIRIWVDEASIPEELKIELRAQVDRCLDPNLRNEQGTHVCKCRKPDPCSELVDVIWTKAEAAHKFEEPPPQPQEAEEAWLQVKSDFDHFPTGRA